MKIRPSIAALALVPFLAVALAATRPQEKTKPARFGGEFAIDSVHSTILFKVKHLNTAWIFGRFDQMDGSFTIDTAKPESSKVEVTVQATSLDTGNQQRDDHLRSPDFFDVKQFPTITFKSKSVARKSENVYTVTGDLSLHGVTKPVTIDMEHVGSNDHPMAGRIAGCFGILDLKRNDFGVSYGLDSVSDEVQLTISFEGKAKDKK